MTSPSGFTGMALRALLVFAISCIPPRLNIAAAQSAPARAGIVQLFEWPWQDIARECVTFLGPKRFWAVQISPPNDHAKKPGDPWWQRYQPVSYELISRSGDRKAFANMTAVCRDAGVAIIADVVLNHMTADGGMSSAGNRYDKYDYPQFKRKSFNEPFCKIGSDYQDRHKVQYCELGDGSTLADLRTGDDSVRNLQAAYLADLLDLGVMGFRLDAAKHIPSEDVAEVLARTARLRPGSKPYIFSEVINCDSQEPIKPDEYFTFGDVTEFNYGRNIGYVFRYGLLATLLDERRSWGTWGLLPSFKAVPFLNNHDTVRGPVCSDNILTYKDSSLYNIAQVFTFAWPYGNVAMTSGYGFANSNQGPPLPSGDTADTGGPWGLNDTVSPTGCEGGFPWVCQHRWGNIAAMVGFRAATLGAWSADNRWDNGYQQIAFSRGSLGFVAINNENFPMSRDLQTGMPAGSYCQVLSGDFDLDTRSCSGSTVTVRTDGTTRVDIPPKSAFAIHVGSRL